MDHTLGSQTAPHASSPDMAPLDPPASSSPQVLYMTPNHRVTKARYVTSSDPRGYVPVYEYPLNGQWIMMDTDDGYVLWTGIWKADIVKILESQPDLASKLRRVRGGYLKMQGTWMARDVALELARRVAWNIRYDLVPLFGPSFPDSCLSPEQPGYGKVVPRPPTKTRRSKRSGLPSPPDTSTQLSFSPDGPISPMTSESTSGSTPRVTDLFESPVESNMSLVPERAFNSMAVDDTPGTYGAHGVPEPRSRSFSHSSGQLAYSNHARWSSLAPIKQEFGQEQYDNSGSTAAVGSQHVSTRTFDRYTDQFGFTSPQHGAPNPSHVGQGVNQMRRGSVPHISGYPPATAASSDYHYSDVTIKQERNLSGDSGYEGSFSQPDPSYVGQPQMDLSASSRQYSQYSQSPAYSAAQDVHNTSMHERSRPDPRYAPYPPSQSPLGYGSSTQPPQQSYHPAPPPIRGTGYSSQQMRQQSQPTGGYAPTAEQYHTHQSSTHHHTQSQFHSPQSSSMMQQLSPHSQQSTPQYAATGMGAVPTPLEYDYSDLQSHLTEPDQHSYSDQPLQQGGGHYRGYGNQF
ncbi:unnamed protein product [Rhizoctonia solani]|uniref:HTH APSES-type domain-containing protein n=1 Tax=Rhizoctonia solani TaxID=456999 RepID=A0A8H3HTC4_9AGAM|nr:unnamed protein product [Rhizoctonia solani]